MINKIITSHHCCLEAYLIFSFMPLITLLRVSSAYIAWMACHHTIHIKSSLSKAQGFIKPAPDVMSNIVILGVIDTATSNEEPSIRP